MEKLSVPENICLRTEFWRGFGWPELTKTLIVSAGVLAVLVAYCLIHRGENDLIAATIAMVFTLALCTGFFGKVPGTNQSIYEFIKKQIAFQREQQTFPYRKRAEAYTIVETKPEG